MQEGWTERASPESAGPVAAAAAVVVVVAAAAAAEFELEREVQPDTVAPDTWNNGLTDRKIYWAVEMKLT